MLGRPQAQVVDAFKCAGSFQIRHGDDFASVGPRTSPCRLKQSQNESRRSTTAYRRHLKHFGFHFPTESSGPHTGDPFQILGFVELESKRQPHSISQRLEKLEFIRSGEQQREVLNRDSDRRATLAAPLKQNAPLVDGQVQGGLQALVEFVGFINEHHGSVGRLQQQGVQIGNAIE